MSEEGSESVTADLAGKPVDEAVTAVVEQDSSRDRDEVRRTLETVAEDGVVTRDAVDDALGQVSKVVATPETRVELAARDLAAARETASHVTDLDSVQARLDGFEARLSAVEERTAELGPELQAAVGQQGDQGDIYEIASEVRRITAAANDAQQAADDLKLDIEDFEKWVGSQPVRYRKLDEEVEVAGEQLADLATSLDRDWTDDDAGVWVDATFQHQVLGLVVADLRQAFDDIETWADREDLDRDERAPGIEAELDDLDDRHTTIGERLDDVSRARWRERFEDPLDSLESTFEQFEPPVPWGEVERVLSEHRSLVEAHS
ncbi:halo transducer protein [Haloarchaeobius sp. DT45]|uniref:halo transducer protein n=1 Tax=Haloarchaeobius sp. DT45 TaxID=3446116 RepID=UPI003F6B798F